MSELKEAIRQLKDLSQAQSVNFVGKETATTINFEQYYKSSIIFAITKLSLLERVENMGGVDKYDKDTKMFPLKKDFVEYEEGFNEALELCQADLVRRLEGMEEVITQNIRCIVGENDGKFSTDKFREEVSKLNQVITAHLTRKEEYGKNN